MPYFTVYSSYTGAQCNTPSSGVVTNITSCTDLQTKAPSYRKCTLSNYGNVAIPLSYKTDCVFATTADQAYSQFSGNKLFYETLQYNGTGCTQLIPSETTSFMTLNQCLPLGDTSYKIYASDNFLRNDYYMDFACNGTLAAISGQPIDTCIEGYDDYSHPSPYKLYNKLVVYGNSALSGGASWGLVISLILLQLL